MFSFKSIVLIVAAFTIGTESSAVHSALVAAPAHVGYAHAVPQNIPPYASQVSVVSKALSPLVAAPAVAPLAASYAAPVAAPFAARVAPAIAAPLAASPYVAAPYAAAPYLSAPAAFAAAPYTLPSPFAAPAAYAAPYPYAASSPFVRTPFGVAPAFVR